MKKLIFAATVVLTFSSFAQSDCITTYREGYLDLRDVAVDFNSGLINRFETVAEVSAVKTMVATKAGLCSLAGTSKAEKTCVSDYKSLYNRLVDNINTVKITTGSQDEISFGPEIQADENEGIFGRAFRNGISFGTRQLQRGELAIIDVRCID